MFADQLEVSHAVVETAFVETDDVGFATEMIGVTGPALRRAGVGVPAMKS
jgi:hypothetical protein